MMTAEAQRTRRQGRERIDRANHRAAIEVHTTLGPGLLESTYEECLAREMQLSGLGCQRQVPLPVAYKGVNLDCGYRLDFLVEHAVVLELKSTDALRPIHEAQLLTYLRLGGWAVGLLINFNVPVLENGIRRLVLNYEDISASSASLR
jgi:GxxExxY protein